MLTPSYTSQFNRDKKRMLKQAGNKEKELKNIMKKLCKQEPLAARHRDHGLSGNWRDHRECHIKPDWLLIYRIEGGEICLVRTGSHADLFD